MYESEKIQYTELKFHTDDPYTSGFLITLLDQGLIKFFVSLCASVTMTMTNDHDNILISGAPKKTFTIGG